MVTLSDFPETLWLWSMPYEIKILKIRAYNYLLFPRYSHPNIKPLPENWVPQKCFCFWCYFQSPVIHTVSCKAVFLEVIWDRAYFTKQRKKEKKKNILLFWEIAAILFLKKNFEKMFFSNFKGPKIKNKSFFLRSYPVFLKNWAELPVKI